MVRLDRRTVPFLAAMLVAWHGMLLSLPHVHDEPGGREDVPRCAASRPGSFAVHLHDGGRTLPPRVCLSCLVGQTAATVSGWQPLPGLRPASPIDFGEPVLHRESIGLRLPLLRAPPSVA